MLLLAQYLFDTVTGTGTTVLAAPVMRHYMLPELCVAARQLELQCL